MDISNKTPWQVRLAALFIFLIGFAAGALTLNLLRPAHSWPAAADRSRRFEHALDRLNLTADQRAQIEKILNDSRAQFMAMRKEIGPRFRDIRMTTRTRIREVLTPEQQQQLQELMKERDTRRREWNRAEP